MFWAFILSMVATVPSSMGGSCFFSSSSSFACLTFSSSNMFRDARLPLETSSCSSAKADIGETKELQKRSRSTQKVLLQLRIIFPRDFPNIAGYKIFNRGDDQAGHGKQTRRDELMGQAG